MNRTIVSHAFYGGEARRRLFDMTQAAALYRDERRTARATIAAFRSRRPLHSAHDA